MSGAAPQTGTGNIAMSTEIPANDFMIDGPAGKLSTRSKGLESHPEQIVVLVQGANLTGQAGFDFSFPGGEDYSVMDALVRRGYGTLTFALRGYGDSDPVEDPLSVDTDAALEDLEAVMRWVAEAGYPRPHLLGWSWGGRIVARYAEQHPDAIDRLVLFDPALGGNVSGVHPEEPYFCGDYDWWYKDRLVTEFSDPAARKALAEYVVTHEPRSPAGIRRENAEGTIAAIPEKIHVPTLMLYGSEAAKQDYMRAGIPRADFFERLAARERCFVIVPDCGDYAHLENPRHVINDRIATFLDGK
jgi:pimeloyl-ACP methyl ester carboxylesterase